MNNKIYFMSFTLLLLSSCGFQAVSQKVRLNDDLPLVLNYKVNVGIFHVGEGSLTIGKKTSYCDYAFDGEVWTTGLAKVISKIHYHFRTCVDINTGWPTEGMRYELKGREETYKSVQFDHFSREDSTIFYGTKDETIVLRKEIYDVMSGLLYVWNSPPETLKKGQEIQLKTYWVDEEFDFRVVYGGKEMIKTKKGEVMCHKFLPVTEIGEYFTSNRDVTVWISDDEAYIPLRIVINLKSGTLTGELRN